jgi:hypothetical protein
MSSCVFFSVFTRRYRVSSAPFCLYHTPTTDIFLSITSISSALFRLPGEGERGNPMVDPRVTLMGRLVPVEASKVNNVVCLCIGQLESEEKVDLVRCQCSFGHLRK